MGTDIEPVPVTGLAVNFSPMPRMAPPPLGKVIAGSGDLCPSSCPPAALSSAMPPPLFRLGRRREDPHAAMTALRETPSRRRQYQCQSQASPYTPRALAFDREVTQQEDVVE